MAVRGAGPSSNILLPSSKGSDIGDVGDAKARYRIKLEKEYTLPKVSNLMLLTRAYCALSELLRLYAR